MQKRNPSNPSRVLHFAFCFLHCCIALAVLSPLAAQAQLADGDLVARVGAYVGHFYRSFGSVVAEERYEQAVRRAPGSSTTSVRRGDSGPVATTLVSDFLLVQVPGEGWMPFRDVFERDGKQVRDREERLAKIFLDNSRDSLDQMRAIMNESARYNIGNVQRNINMPTMTLVFLTDAERPHFAFKMGKTEDEGVVIEFRETARPTFVRTVNNRDITVNGRIWVDEQDGTIHKTELHAVDTNVEAHITVTYTPDAALGVWVPSRMEERYRAGRDSTEVRGTATYSKFRRFQVKTSENIDDPK